MIVRIVPTGIAPNLDYRRIFLNRSNANEAAIALLDLGHTVVHNIGAERLLLTEADILMAKLASRRRSRKSGINETSSMVTPLNSADRSVTCNRKCGFASAMPNEGYL